MYMLNEWCWDKEKFPPPLFSFCLATLLLFLLQVISKRPAAVSISLSLSLSLRALFTLPLYGYRPHSVTCLLRFKHCGVWSPLCGCNLCHQTGQLTSKEWRRWGGGDKYEEGKVNKIKNDRKGANTGSGWWKALTGKARKNSQRMRWWWWWWWGGCHGWGIKPVFAFNACGQSPIWLKLWNNTQSDSGRNVAAAGFGIRAALSQSPKHATEHYSLRGEA